MKKNEKSGGMILSFLSQVISIVVGLAYSPIMIRILGTNEYGLYQLVLSVVNYLNLMNLGFNGAYIRYYSIAKQKKDEKEVARINGMFFNVFMIIAVLCLIAGVILYGNIYILGDKISEADYIIARKLLVILVINLALSFPNSLFVAYMSANERFVFQKVLNIVFNLLVPVLNLPLLLWGYGSVGLVSATLVLTVVRLVINVYYCVKALEMKLNIFAFDIDVFKSLLKYTFFIFLSDLVDQLNSNVDKFLLGKILGTVAVAIYSVGFNLKNYFVMISWIAPEVYIPEVNRVAIEEKNDTRLTQLFTRVGRINNYLVLLVLTGFILFGKVFIRLWVGPEYDTAYYGAVMLMVAGYIPAVQTLGTNVQNAKNMHQVRSIVYFVVAVLNVISSIFLIKLWGVLGTCLGTLLATLIGHGIFMNAYYHKKIGLNIISFWKEMSKWYFPVGFLFIITIIILRYAEVTNWFTFLVGIVIYSCAYAILLYLFGLKKDEKELIRQKLYRR